MRGVERGAGVKQGTPMHGTQPILRARVLICMGSARKVPPHVAGPVMYAFPSRYLKSSYAQHRVAMPCVCNCQFPSPAPGVRSTRWHTCRPLVNLPRPRPPARIWLLITTCA